MAQPSNSSISSNANVLLLICCSVPESTRWLIIKGKYLEAEYNIQKTAKENGKFEQYVQLKPYLKKLFEDPKAIKSKTTACDLFKTEKLLFRTLNMGLQWFAVISMYYTLLFESITLIGDPYINFFLGVMIEIPAYALPIILKDLCGRKRIISFCHFVNGISCILYGLLCSILINEDSIDVIYFKEISQTILSLMGRFGTSIGFATIYIFTAELFPTEIRCQAVGTCSMVARMGNIVVFSLQFFKVYWLPHPVLIMGVVAIVAGLLTSFFPETQGQKLPETIEESINIGEKLPETLFD